MSLKAGAGMIYEGLLSLKIEPVAALPASGQLAAINEANDVLLNNLLLLDEKHDSDEHDEVMQELRRQDMKIRMLMDLLAMLLLQNQLLPALRPVRFSGEELSVQSTDPTLQKGALVQCSLFIDPALPKPLILFAESQGIASDSVGEAADEWHDFTFAGLSLPVQDNIEKLIFRHHRKAVAQQRRQNSASGISAV